MDYFSHKITKILQQRLSSLKISTREMLTRQFLREDFLLTGNFGKPIGFCEFASANLEPCCPGRPTLRKWICHFLFQFATGSLIYWAPRLSQLFQLKPNWPFPSSKNSHFRNEAKFKTFLVKMKFICMGIKNHFQLSMALHLASLWNTGLSQLENDRLKTKMWKNNQNNLRSLFSNRNCCFSNLVVKAWQFLRLLFN